ncbi:glycoside hydrolase family 5 protein [Silvibacterium acidisoli]|uniref:glycoside hydrolase family 5 protein n=1 Tax=Acidobacteriaceae bacterium ZG23-2 TaxID=2883246 RepID=UPI00406BECB6
MSSCSSGSAPKVLPGQITLVNNRLMRDGQPWVPHGFFQVAFQASPNEQNVPNFEAQAQANYTPLEYSNMVKAGADSVRVMLGQTVGDPQNTQFYSKDFVNQFIAAVQSARNAGLTVIVSIQDESIVQDQNPTPLPNDATQRVWAQLMPAFKDDKGIVLELFNEAGTGPTQVPTATDWQNWAAAMNATIDSVRSEGATNVVVADGLAHAGTLSGAPDLTDKLNSVAYASHPYTFSADSEKPANEQSFLDVSFGNFAANHPVIITEWGQGYYCGPTNPGFLIYFLNYLQQKGIGLEMSFWDWGGPTAFGGTQYNFPNTQVSMYYDNGSLIPCSTNGSPTPQRGPGQTINTWYATGTIPDKAI